MITFIVVAIISGAIIGALARLAVPGPNPMGVTLTILVGIVGAVVGALVGGALDIGLLLTFIVEVAVSAGLVYLISRRKHTAA